MQPIAVVGLSCRFPGAADAAAFWELLASGGDAITEVPPERWDLGALYDPDSDAPGRVATRWGGFLPHVDRFDAAFFNISPREAERVDPQQRLILELAWEALENAGIPAQRLAGSDAGVFVAVSHSDYARLINGDWSRIIAYNGAGMYHSIAANRLSYTLDLRGPSMVIDTACSSSLVAVHVACQHLRLGETSLAIVGGVNLNLDPVETIGLTKGRMLSPDGRCKSFDDSANGYVRSDGCGVVLLKRLADALRDGDPVRAVIRGSAVNQDGLTNGLYAPSGPAQQAVIRRALAAARTAPADVSYVEAHGTGTSLGDPIEMRSLISVLGEGRAADNICWVGAVKTNVGHLEAASGMAGLLKTILALEHREIPRNLHLRKLNRYIKLDGTPFRIPEQPVPWPGDAGAAPRPRTAGVSAFGFGGTNAHVVLEEAPRQAEAAPRAGGVHLFTLSAKTEPALRAMALAYRERIAASAADGQPALRDLCYTANHGRSHFKQRLAIAAGSVEAIAAGLEDFAQGRAVAGGHAGLAAKPRKIAFMFTGQGSQYAGMGRGAYERYPVYREQFDQCGRILRGLLDIGLEELAWGAQAPTHLLRTEFVQPALFALEYALARQLIAWGLQPQALLGHSLGEIVAACIAGVMPLESALKFVVARARLMQALPAGGAMLAVSAPAESAARLLSEHAVPSVCVAARNGPASFVLSGLESEIARLQKALAEQAVPHARLQVSHAFHSVLMAPIAEELRAAAAAMTTGAPRCTVISNLTGEPVAGQYLEPQYWVHHALSPVMFWPGVQSLLASGCDLLIEIGPHPALAGALDPALKGSQARLAGTLRRSRDDGAALADMLAQAYACGAALDWASYERPLGGRTIPLPAYPFQRQRHWYETQAAPAPSGDQGPLLADIDLRATPYLADHVVQGRIVLPAAAHLELALAAAARLFPGGGPVVLRKVEFKRLCVLENDGATKTLLLAAPVHAAGAVRPFSIAEAGAPTGAEYVSGEIHAGVAEAPAPVLPAPQAGGIWCTPAEVEDYYRELSGAGLQYGSAFRGIAAWRCDPDGQRLTGRVALPQAAAAARAAILHPVLLDACLQLVGVLAAEAGHAGLFVPTALAGFRFLGKPAGDSLHCRVELRAVEPSRLHADIEVFDAAGGALCVMEGLRLDRLPAAAETADWQFVPAWLPAPAAAAPSGGGEDLLVLCTRPMDAADVPPSFAARFRSVAVLQTDGEGDWLGALERMARPPRVIVLLCCAVLPARAGESPAPSERLLPECMVLVELAKALSDRADASFRLVVATCGAHQVVEGDVPDPLQAALWGLARVVAMECPKLGCRVVDLPGALSAAQLPWDGITHAMGAPGPEFQFAWRGRLAYRFALARSGGALPAAPFRLTLESYGELDGLAFRSAGGAAACAPGVGEVEVRVHAAALNFRDVLNALGSLKAELASQGIERPADIPFGGECAGTVTRVGSGVRRFAAGDEVIVALTPGCLASTVNAPVHRVIRKPEAMGFAAAAAVPTAYLTAYYALKHCADVRAGQSVLVHAASGGVGQAALGYLRRVGAQIYATTSAGKRAFVQAQGVEAVLDSRSTSFGGELRRLTGGRGVDVVLNSLSGEFIPASLEAVAPGGVFVEIGKRGAWSAEQVRLCRPDLRYIRFDLLELEREQPARIAALLAEIESDLATGRIARLPLAQYPACGVAAAFRHLAGAQHVGKVVVSFDDAAPSRAAHIDGAGAYLVTGGLGALGLRLAGWLARKGAGYVLLVGRGEPSASQAAELARLAQSGARVSFLRADVAAPGACQRMAAGLSAAGLPLRGMFHLAAVLDDATLLNQSAERFRRVMAPKVDGAWNLHRLGADWPGAFLVCYSSLASIVGSPGQANYAAANGFLDGLAEHRRAAGQHGLSINWGPLDQIGLAADDEARRRSARSLAQAGLRPIDWRRGIRLLEQHLAAGAARALVMRVDAARFRDALRRDYPQLAGLFGELPASRAPAGGGADALRAELGAKAPAEARRRIAQVVAEHLAAVLRMPVEDLETEQTWSQLGVDSLLAMEVKVKLELLFGTGVGDALSLQSATVASVAAQIHRAMPGREAPDGGNLEALVPAAPTAADSCVAYYTPRAAARARLICFHHLGGSAAAYRGWAELLPQTVELVPVQLPGRENRAHVPSFTAFEPLVPAIAQDLLAYLDRPFALYGHSMGSLLAYEVCRYLHEARSLQAAHLFVGGLWAPPAHSLQLRRRPVSTDAVMADAELPAAMLSDPAVGARLAEIFSSDCELFRSYRYRDGPRLPVGICALYGSQDPVASSDELRGWQALSAEPLTIERIEGRHMFHKTNAAAVLAALACAWPALGRARGVPMAEEAP